jgi:hypothetical protein
MLQDAEQEGEMGFHLCHQCDRMFITYVLISDRMCSGEFSVMGESLMEQCSVEAVTQWIKVTLLLHFVFSNLCQQAFVTAGAGASAQLISKLVGATMILRGGKLLSSLEEMVFVFTGILGKWC